MCQVNDVIQTDSQDASMPPSPVRGRLAPSPTGYMHLGNVWSFMHAWLSVRTRGGRLILRFEDIDARRSSPEFARGIAEDLIWLGIDWDEGPFYQSDRIERYGMALKRLQDMGVTYRCYCTRKEIRGIAGAPHGECSPYPGTCRNLSAAEAAAREKEGRRWTIRVRYPDARLEVRDMFLSRPGAEVPVSISRLAGCTQKERGLFSFLPESGGDFAICRSDGVMAYVLAVVVDDWQMGITEVIRGDDLLPATPTQIYLHRLLGNPRLPSFGHVPLVLDAGGERLAKRHGSLQVKSLRASGVMAEAILGYLAFLGGLLPAFQPISLAELAAIYKERPYVPRGPILLPKNSVEILRQL